MTRNARTHSESQIAQIRASLREFGFVNPVIIDSDRNIIAGHGRVLAAKAEGMTEVPCVLVERPDGRTAPRVYSGGQPACGAVRLGHRDAGAGARARFRPRAWT